MTRELNHPEFVIDDANVQLFTEYFQNSSKAAASRMSALKRSLLSRGAIGDLVSGQVLTKRLDEWRESHQRWEHLEPNINNRAHIVSEQLCDDALNVLAPSLEKYKGGTIIDCNPGVGLWSRKVHELVQPKKHILLEPHRDQFNDFLQPLTREHNSTYIHHDLANFNRGSLRTPWRHYLAKVAAKTIESPLAPEPGVPVLVLANQAYGSPIRRTKSAKISHRRSEAETFAYYFLCMLQFGSGWHANGPAKLLMWTYNEEKHNVVPRNINSRKGVAMRLNEPFSVREIVGSKDSNDQRRLSKLDVESAIMTARRMKDMGVVIPKHRRSDLHNAALQAVNPVGFDDEGSSWPYNIIDELANLERLERALYEAVFSRWKSPPPGADKRKLYVSNEYLEIEAIRRSFDLLTHNADAIGLKSDDVSNFIIANSDLNQCERRLCRAKEQGNVAASVQEESHMKAYAGEVQKRSLNVQTYDKTHKAMTDIDNLEALRSDPPLLAFDRRTHEPLETTSHEFWPSRKLALLDIDPRPHAKPGMSLIYEEIVVQFLYHYAMENYTVEQAISTIENGAVEAIIPHCPSLRDPLRGGRLHLENLRVRMLTEEMLREIAQAWKNWPMKPGDESLHNRLSKQRDTFP